MGDHQQQRSVHHAEQSQALFPVFEPVLLGPGQRVEKCPLSHLEAENQALTLQNDRLRLELGTLKRSARLEKLAKDSLGMAPPAPGAVTVLARPAPRPAPARPVAVAGRP